MTAACFTVVLALTGCEHPMTFRSAPIDLAGYETRRQSADIPTPPSDGDITSMHAYVVDEQGREVPQERVMLHHVLFMNKGRFSGDRTSDDCKRQKHEKFYGTGEEDQELVLPSGLRLSGARKGDRWRLLWMLMNHNARNRARADGVASTGPRPNPAPTSRPVKPHWISLAMREREDLQRAGWRGPAARRARARGPGRCREDGRIVAAGAHAHGGAQGVSTGAARLRDRHLLTSDARYGMADDPIYKVSPVLARTVATQHQLRELLDRRGRSRRGERLRLHALYDERPARTWA